VLTGLVATALNLQTRASTFQKTAGGASVSVESEPGKNFSLCLAFRVPPTLAPWQAHLVEHVLVAGKDGTLPARLQTYDIRIQGITTRNQLNIVMDGPSSEVQAAIVALGEILDNRTPTDLTREIAVLREERALRPLRDQAADEAYASVPIGPLFPGEDAPAPEKPTEGLLVQSGTAVALVCDADTRGLADRLLKSLATLPSGPRSWPEIKLQPVVRTPKAVAIRIGPAGTPGMLAGSAAALALVGRLGGVGVFDPEGAPGYAVLISEPPSAQAIDDAVAAAPQVAKFLTSTWTTDNSSWVRFKAASMLAGLRIKRSDLTGLASDLRPSDYAAALEPLRS